MLNSGRQRETREPPPARFLIDLLASPADHTAMGRALRITAGGLVYHVLNRANRRVALFEGEGEYRTFLQTMAEAQAEHPIRVLSYCLMPNHWHLVLWPEQDRRLSRFAGWLTLTQTQCWQVARG